jgi:hypothetical protein
MQPTAECHIASVTVNDAVTQPAGESREYIVRWDYWMNLLSEREEMRYLRILR